MAAPFSGEDLFKRSLIGSILGFKIKTPKFHHSQQQQQQGPSNVRQHSTAAPQFDYDQPCSSKTVLQLDAERQQTFVSNNCVQGSPSTSRQQFRQHPHHQQQLQFHKHQNLVEYGIRSGRPDEADSVNLCYGGATVGTVAENVSLSDQLSESLFLASPQALTPTSQFSADSQPATYHSLVCSPHDIYQEIVHECEPFLGKSQLDQSLLMSSSDVPTSLAANATKTDADFGLEMRTKIPYFSQMEHRRFQTEEDRPLSAFPLLEPNQNFIKNNEIHYYGSPQQTSHQSYYIPNPVGAIPNLLPPTLPSVSPLRVRHSTAPTRNSSLGSVKCMEVQNRSLASDDTGPFLAGNSKMGLPPSYGQQLQQLRFPDDQLHYGNQDRKLPTLDTVDDAHSHSFYTTDNSQPPIRNESNYFAQETVDTEDFVMKSAAEVLASKILLGIEVAADTSREVEAKGNKNIPIDQLREQRLQKLGSILNGQVSLEELVKMVVAAVKEAGGLGGVVAEKDHSEKQKHHTSPQPQPPSIQSSKRSESAITGETPEEILQRKRQQNNEAAARYRKRQRSARFVAEDEIQGLMKRNAEIRAEIVMVEREIEVLKEQFTIADPRPTERSAASSEKIEQTDNNDVEIYPKPSKPHSNRSIMKRN